ncbi:MAG: LytR family transcriptional regulator [Chloroflexi bacterium]|nr:LytR family transcriptional regulator [Chloroflexota bacterium]MYE78455.1 LytR family transcriptional regulator [Chloroflexota bacterium]
MRAFSPLLSRFTRVSLWILLAALILALGWSLLQLLELAAASNPAGDSASRRAAYRATATAMSSSDATSGLSPRWQFVLLQDASTPAAPPSPTSTTENEAPNTIPLPTLLVPAKPSSPNLAGTKVPPPAQRIIRAHSLVNIALLGGDNELTEDQFVRTDTMVVVSLNLDTGDAAMLSLPRDLFVYMPHGNMGRLNTAYGIGDYREWQPGGGFGFLRQTLFYNFGINVHYYALVNFSAFEAVIDRLGGVNIAVDCAYRDYYPVARDKRGSANPADYALRTLPVGYHSFDGFDALWYARTRRNTSDLDRGRRQQILLRAMWRAARQQGLLTAIPSLWRELTSLTETDIPFDLILRLLPHLLNLELDSIEHFTFQSDFHTRDWVASDGAQVLLPMRDRVHQLMQDFYTPPSPNQASLAMHSIGIYNASSHENWDIVASERLRWGGHQAIALGTLTDSQFTESSQLIDQVGTQKGSPVPRLLAALNLDAEQVTIDPKADRAFDYLVIIGRDYESCTFDVLPIDE